MSSPQQYETSPRSSGPVDPLLVEHRRVWQAKPTLRVLYGDYHRRLIEVCPSGPVLDIGGGSAHVKEFRKEILSVDILPFPGIDVVCDAHELPFKDSEFAGIIMLDVLHHLERPVDFLAEAARILRPGGVLAMIEPGMTTLSYPFFRFMHQEPADLGVDPFNPISQSDRDKDPWHSNQAIPTLLFARERNLAELSRRVPQLRLKKKEWLSFVAYPLSGGFKKWCLMPASMTERVVKLEDRLPEAVRRHAAFRLFTVLERIADRE
jgi:SAM-dependent methyltransferase